jgi:hypothetical protein
MTVPLQQQKEINRKKIDDSQFFCLIMVLPGYFSLKWLFVEWKIIRKWQKFLRG